MNEYESTLSGERDVPAPQPGHIPAAPGSADQEAAPHHVGDPAQVVSRMPDLGPGETEIPSEPPRRRRRRSRPKKSTLSNKTWTWIGMGSISIAVIAVALFWNGKDSSESLSDERAGWEPKSPAPDAPMAPIWGGAPAEGTDWQNAAAASPYQQPDGYAGSPSFNTAVPGSQPPTWDDPSQVSSPPSWAGQPETAAWGSPTQTPAGAPQSPWGHAASPSYPDPQGYAERQPTSSWPAPPYASAGEQIQAETPPWAADTRSAPMAASSPRTAMAGQTGGYSPTSPPAGSTLPYVGQYQPATAAPAFRDSYQNSYQAPYQPPSVEASRPLTTGSFEPNGFQQPYAPRPQGASAVYPTDPTSSVARRNDYRTAYPQSTTNPSSSQPSSRYSYGGSPTTGTPSGYGSTYRGTPSSASSSSSTYPSSTYPSSTYPASAYPSSTYPSSTYPSSTYPSSTYPSSTYPASTYPASTYPASAYPASTYPSSRDSSSYPATAYPSASSSYPAASSSARPGTGVSTPYPRSGTARLNGVIETASPRTSYDRSRTSLY